MLSVDNGEPLGSRGRGEGVDGGLDGPSTSLPSSPPFFAASLLPFLLFPFILGFT